MVNKKYKPSNGTEGMWFTGNFCDRCVNQHPDPDNPNQCDILCRSLIHDTNEKEYPEEWTYDEKDRPTCTAFIKWDWQKDDDGNFIEPPPRPFKDPNQLEFNFE